MDGDHELGPALALAYRYLNRRERTVSEVRAHLLAHGAGGDATAAAIEALTGHGYLDDERFARAFVQDKRALEQWGAERIMRGLLAHGIDYALAESALAEGSGEHGGVESACVEDGCESELDRALALLAQRFPSPPRDRRRRDRALGVLLRKGYDYELALDALAAYGRDA